MDIQAINTQGETRPDPAVMIIGSDKEAISEIASLLKKAGIEAMVIQNGSWNIEILKEISPSMVIVDEESKWGGWEISSQIRHDSPVPIILLGTIESEIAWVKAAAYGVDCYLEKPFRPSELVTRIKALVRRHNNRIRTPGTRNPKVTC